MMKCKICNREFKSAQSLGLHVKQKHNISTQQYYDMFFWNPSRDEGFCLICGKSTRFVNLAVAYQEYCSSTCANTSDKVKKHKEESYLKKYGVTNPSKSQEIKDKKIKTCLKNHGVENPSQSKEIRQKQIQTMLDNYGVDNAAFIPGIIDKKRETCLNKYGVASHTKVAGIKWKSILTRLKNNTLGVLNNKPIYNYYAPKLKYVEEVRKVGIFLQVKCKYCQEWFTPTYEQVDLRLQALKGSSRGDGNMYCSETCKHECPIYNQTIWPKGENPNPNRPGHTTWRLAVLERDEYTCVKCGNPGHIAHHIDPVKTDKEEALNIENGICVCKSCHDAIHVGKCSYGYLANLVI